MPTYEYECDGCGHEFELFQSMKDDPIKTCPECKKKKVRRLLGSGAGIIFKGSGFYETDYKRKDSSSSSSNGSNESGSGDSKKSESKEGAKSEKKTEKKKSKPSKPAA